MRRTLLLALGAQGNPSESFPSPASEEPPTCRGESGSADSVALQFQPERFPCVLSVYLGAGFLPPAAEHRLYFRKMIVFLLGTLKPNESLTQLVSGLIVVLTFTLAASVATGGGEEGARAALLGAIGANASWAIINAVLYIMDSAFDRNRQLRIARSIASTPEEDAALAAIRTELDPYIASVTQPEDREQLYRSVRNSLVHGRMPKRTAFLRDDIMGAVAVFC